MIVCICRNKNDVDVRRAIREGAESILDLQLCGIGTDCGSCHPMLRQMLAEAAVPAGPLPASPDPASDHPSPAW